MEPYQKKVSLKHMRMKRRLIGQGKQKASEAGSPFTQKPSFKRSKSAPPIGETQQHKIKQLPHFLYHYGPAKVNLSQEGLKAPFALQDTPYWNNVVQNYGSRVANFYKKKLADITSNDIMEYLEQKRGPGGTRMISALFEPIPEKSNNQLRNFAKTKQLYSINFDDALQEGYIEKTYIVEEQPGSQREVNKYDFYDEVQHIKPTEWYKERPLLFSQRPHAFLTLKNGVLPGKFLQLIQNSNNKKITKKFSIQIGEQVVNISEESAMSAGSVEGCAGISIPNKKKKEEEQNLMEEQKLREHIRNLISEMDNNKNNIISEETKLRNFIKTILLKEGEEDSQYSSTGINILEDLLKRIIPIIEEEYKSLTTAPEQRASYRAHIINAVQNLLLYDPKNLEQLEKKGEVEEEIDVTKLDEEENLEEKNINVNVEPGEKENNFEKFVDIKQRKIEKKHKSFKALPEEDLTGRNIALHTFERIERNILDSYSLLDNEDDQDIFYDYLITNLKLYFDKYEQEMQGQIDEPDNAIYQKKQSELKK